MSQNELAVRDTVHTMQGETMSNPVPVKEVTRLTPEALRKLEGLLNPPDIAPANDNPLYAGQIIGIQKVLKLLREGFQT